MARPEDSWRGKVRGMTSDEVEDFLKQGINMYLACLDQDGDPYITVCWHEWRDGHFWVIPRQRSRWAEYGGIVSRNLVTLFNILVTPAAVALFFLEKYQGAIAVSGMAIVNTVLGLAQELRAKWQLERLAILVETKARSRRDHFTACS